MTWFPLGSGIRRNRKMYRLAFPYLQTRSERGAKRQNKTRSQPMALEIRSLFTQQGDEMDETIPRTSGEPPQHAPTTLPLLPPLPFNCKGGNQPLGRRPRYANHLENECKLGATRGLEINKPIRREDASSLLALVVSTTRTLESKQTSRSK